MLEIEQLYFVPPPAPTRFDDPESASWLREKLRSSIDYDPNAKRRIYLTRADAKIRRLSNEDEIMPILSSKGFECISAAELSLDDQGRCFAEADLIVAQHGAALANLYFAKAQTKLLEINSAPAFRRGHYWSLSCALDLDYYFESGDQLDTSNIESDFKIDIERFKKALSLIC